MIDALTDMLATARLTRLVTRDKLTAEPRGRAIRAVYARKADADTFAIEGALAGDPAKLDGWDERAAQDGLTAPMVAQLVTCSWCASVWIAAAVLAARSLVPWVWRPLARLLAASEVAGLLAIIEAAPVLDSPLAIGNTVATLEGSDQQVADWLAGRGVTLR